MPCNLGINGQLVLLTNMTNKMLEVTKRLKIRGGGRAERGAGKSEVRLIVSVPPVPIASSISCGCLLYVRPEQSKYFSSGDENITGSPAFCL